MRQWFNSNPIDSPVDPLRPIITAAESYRLKPRRHNVLLTGIEYLQPVPDSLLLFPQSLGSAECPFNLP